MARLETNRELYIAIRDLCRRNKHGSRTLEEYLLALRDAARAYSAQSQLTVETFFELLSAAFTQPFSPFDDSWRGRDDEAGGNLNGFEGWESCVIDLIVDLREMAEQGMLEDKSCYLGIDAPRGGRLYNFDPYMFLECGAQGFFGGWEPGDESGRMLVPGSVLVRGDDGQLGPQDPADVTTPQFIVPQISWDDFHTFLCVAQWYE